MCVAMVDTQNALQEPNQGVFDLVPGVDSGYLMSGFQ